MSGICLPYGGVATQTLSAQSASWPVAQVSNLLYRSASSLQTLIGSRRANVVPIGNRRYSRLETWLETCATAWAVARRCARNALAQKDADKVDPATRSGVFWSPCK